MVTVLRHCDDLIEDIPVINRPSYFLVNNYGNEGYMTILEPVGDFRRTPERVKEARKYDTVVQLASAFKAIAPVGNTESGYKRKDIVEISFMGFDWVWRPNHKSFYGNIPAGYELLPLIARWVALTGTMAKIDNGDPAYLPARYKGGTGRGFGNFGENMSNEDTSKMALDKHIQNIQETISNNILIPIAVSLKGSYLRAAQMNIVPNEAFEVYDGLMHSLMTGDVHSVKSVPESKYVIMGSDSEKHQEFIGGFYGAASLPDWATEIATGEKNGVDVTVAKIKANTIEEAESLMVSLEKK